MTADPAAPADSPSSGPDRSLWREWLLVAAFSSGLLFLGAARLPQQAKVPFVLSAGLAAALGFGLGQLGRTWRLKSPRVVGLMLGLLVAAGLTLGAYDTHRRLAEFARNERVDPLPDLGGMDEEFQNMLDRGEVPEGATNVNAEELRRALELRRSRNASRERERELKQTFAGYLVFRIPREWGRWPTWAAVAFWLAEVAVAAVLAARVAAGQIEERL